MLPCTMRCLMLTQASSVKLTASTANPMRAAGMARNTRTRSSTAQTASTQRNQPATTRRGVKPYSRIYTASLAPARAAKASP